MTNQPDESHPLRDRVDEAISWFTQTDEPPEPEVAPVAEPSAHAADVTPVAETAVPENAPDQPVVPVGPVPAEVPTEPLPAEVPAAPLPAEVPDESRPTEVPAEPTAASAPVERLDQAEVAPERTYEADEFSAHPKTAVPAQVATSDVADERVTEADDFVPTHAAQEPAVESEPALEPEPVVAAPVAKHVESSAVDEPTRIHPIEPPSSWAEVHPDAKGIPEDAIDSEAETTAARRSLFRDEAPTVALPLGAAAAAAGAATVEPSPVIDPQEAARVRREERAARDRQLGKVIAAPDDADEPLVTKFATPSTYKALPSVGLLLFRVVIAAVVGIRAWQHITHLTATREMWAATVAPSPGIFASTQIGLEIAIAVMLLLGLGSRIAGLLLTVLSVALLLFVQWGAVNPFQPGASDFIGVVDVLLAGAGLLFATVGGGRLAFDGGLHSGRIRRKNDKLYS